MSGLGWGARDWPRQLECAAGICLKGNCDFFLVPVTVVGRGPNGDDSVVPDFFVAFHCQLVSSHNLRAIIFADELLCNILSKDFPATS